MLLQGHSCDALHRGAVHSCGLGAGSSLGKSSNPGQAGAAHITCTGKDLQDHQHALAKSELGRHETRSDELLYPPEAGLYRSVQKSTHLTRAKQMPCDVSVNAKNRNPSLSIGPLLQIPGEEEEDLPRLDSCLRYPCKGDPKERWPPNFLHIVYGMLSLREIFSHALNTGQRHQSQWVPHPSLHHLFSSASPQ